MTSEGVYFYSVFFTAIIRYTTLHNLNAVSIYCHSVCNVHRCITLSNRDSFIYPLLRPLPPE